MEIVTTEFFESIDPQLRDEVDGRNRHVWDHFSDGTTTYHVRMPLQYLREASNQAQHNEGHVTLPLPQLELEQHTQYHYPDPELSGICGTELSGSLASSSALQHGGDPEFSASPYNNEHAMQPQPGNVPMSPATRRSQYPEFAANDLSYEYGARTRKGTLPPFSTIAGFDQDTNRYHNEAYYPHEANLFGRPANGSLPPFSAIASSGQDTNGHANEVAYPTPTSLSAPQTQSINNTPGGRASRRAAGVLDTARNALAAAHDMLKPIFTSNTNVQFSLGWMEDNNIDDTLLDGMSYDHVFMHWETLCRYGVLLPGDTLRVTFYPLDSGSAPTDVDAQILNNHVARRGNATFSDRPDIQIATAQPGNDGVVVSCKGPKQLLEQMNLTYAHLGRANTGWLGVSLVRNGRNFGTVYHVRAAYCLWVELHGVFVGGGNYPSLSAKCKR